jgi:hypothetical protein
VYWLTVSGNVERLDKDKTEPVTLANDQPGLARLVLDGADVYFTAAGISPGRGKVARVPKAGGAVTDLATDQSEPFGIAVDESGIYWANHGDGSIMKRSR